MNLDINVIINDNCSITIEDLTKYADDSSDTEEYTRAESTSVNLIRYNRIELEEYSSLNYLENTNQELVILNINKDGFFTVVHLVMPNKVWIASKEELVGSQGLILSYPGGVYYCDSQKIYKYSLDGEEEVSIADILGNSIEGSTIFKTKKDLVSICFLRKCYLNLCQKIFSLLILFKCYNKNNIDSELIYKRDLVWMAINIIEYLTKYGQVCEVERIIEIILGCNGLCPPSNGLISNDDCGCS